MFDAVNNPAPDSLNRICKEREAPYDFRIERKG